MAEQRAEVDGDRISDMKSAIHSFLSQSNVYDAIRDIVDTYVSENEGTAINPDSPNDIMKVIKERGILQQLLLRMRNEAPLRAKQQQMCNFTPGDGEYYLHVRLNGGRAFVDNLDLPAGVAKQHQMFVGVHFGTQRFRSLLVQCSSNPQFEDDFVFRLEASAFGFPRECLIEVPTPFHIAVFRENTCQGVAEVLGENILDWRRVLKTGFLGLTVELCGRNAGVPAGILDLQLELVSTKRVRYKEEDIATRFDQQRNAITSADREFLVYARRWWSEYQSVRATHKSRKVKLFATAANGRMVPVTHFVSPLQAEFGISSPLDAARFVSLLKVIGNNETISLHALENVDTQTWLSPFVFLSQRQGRSCNHATLLCSLLLGFGLDAFCAIGSSQSGETLMFTITRARSHNGEITTTLWDALSGERSPQIGSQTVSTVDCLFNHKSFFANNQPTNSIAAASFDVENEVFWKPVNPLKLRIVPKYPNPPLLYQPTNCQEVEQAVEMKLREHIVSFRDTIGALTEFDDNLCYSLAQALASYEVQRRTGKAEDFSFFETCVKGILGPGKTFKAVPINVFHGDGNTIMSAIRSNVAGKDILETVACDVKFGLRVKIFPFPEGVRSAWVMLSVAYNIS